MIEQDLKRIADGVEAILKLMQPIMVVDARKEVVAPAIATTEIKAVIPVKVADAPKPAELVKAVEPSEEEIRNVIREYMNANGKEKAIEMLIKHGAKAEKPMIKDVTNKVGLMTEVKLCLTTVK